MRFLSFLNSFLRKVRIIAFKDIKSFYLSPEFYGVCFFCALVLSWMYPNQLKSFADFIAHFSYQANMPKQQMNIHYRLFVSHIANLNLLLILLVPALTMRLISEEKRQQSFTLLLTSPVTSAEIIAGKYVAALGAVLGLFGISILYPLVTSFFTTFSWPMLFSSYLGLLMVAMLYVAMGLFCSALTDSALLAYVMGFIFNLFVWFIGMGTEMMDSSLMRQVFEHLSVNTHLTGFIKGVVRSSALVFLLSAVGLFAFLSERVIEVNRWR